MSFSLIAICGRAEMIKLCCTLASRTQTDALRSKKCNKVAMMALQIIKKKSYSEEKWYTIMNTQGWLITENIHHLASWNTDITHHVTLFGLDIVSIEM